MLQIFYLDARIYNYFPVIKTLDNPIEDLDISGFNHVWQVFELWITQRAWPHGTGFLVRMKKGSDFCPCEDSPLLFLSKLHKNK